MELLIKNVTKKYKNKVAVNDITLKFDSGVIGLLGENGAGKTTLMRMICGVLRQTEGKISFDGLDSSDEMYRNVIGYLPQDFGYYPSFTGKDYLMYIAALKGIDKKTAKRKSDDLLKMVNLENMADKKIKKYSGGMKQRLGIAQAMLNDPKVLILDEPTAGLDPKERVRFRNLIGDIGKESIVVLSTHIVSDVEHVADRIIMMKSGNIIFDGLPEDIEGDLESFYMNKFGGDIIG